MAIERKHGIRVQTDDQKQIECDIVELAKCHVKDPDGQPIRFNKLWGRRPTLFIFVRNFACIACRSHAKQIWEKREEFFAKGTGIVFIGNGQPNFINEFKKDLGIEEAPIFTDPNLDAFRAAGFKRGFLAALGPSAMKNAFRFNREGHKQGQYKKGMGDLWQLGGLLVVTPQGRVTYEYKSEVLGDFPPESDIPLNEFDKKQETVEEIAKTNTQVDLFAIE